MLIKPNSYSLDWVGPDCRVEFGQINLGQPYRSHSPACARFLFFALFVERSREGSIRLWGTEPLQIRKMTIQSLSSIRCRCRCRCRCMSLHPTFDSISFESRYPLLPAISPPTRRALSLSAVIFTAISTLASSSSLAAPSKSAAPQFFELPDSAGVKALELRIGSGETPVDGDQVN